MSVVRRILMVRPSALGDVCRTVPALATLRHAHRDAEIHWLVNDDFADAVRHHPQVSEVIPFPRKRFAGMWRHPARLGEFRRWLRELAGRGYDLTVDLQGLLRSGLVTRFSGAPTRVGFANARELGWLGYNRRHRVDAGLHTVDRMLALLNAEGYPPRHDMTLYAGDDEKQWAADQFGEPYVCLAPTAKWLCKCWPIGHYLQVARLLKAKGKRVIVIAAPHERDAVQPLLDDGFECPATTVAQLCALIARCDLLICNDSAPLHIAVGFDRPIVTIFGPTDPARVGPYRRGDTVIQPDNITQHDLTRYRSHRDQSLIARVSVRQVWQRAEPLLSC